MIVRTLRQKLRRMLLWTTSTAGICISVSLFPISVTKIIAIYAEQMSPDSSFHSGAGPGEDYEETRRADGAKDLCRSYGGQ